MDIGFGEIVLIFILALFLFGPKKLPTMARDWGRTIHRIKRELKSFLD
ncbi:MAG: twin-arginine translocase TatA/TatE family subunit [Deltaproteobacteria bacterium]|nr:twin-arginine translocase TatA/TatE family subunit [Deltaproteobacteria bacterium]